VKLEASILAGNDRLHALPLPGIGDGDANSSQRSAGFSIHH
jgi:hypothetical protein